MYYTTITLDYIDWQVNEARLDETIHDYTSKVKNIPTRLDIENTTATIRYSSILYTIL